MIIAIQFECPAKLGQRTVETHGRASLIDGRGQETHGRASLQSEIIR